MTGLALAGWVLSLLLVGAHGLRFGDAGLAASAVALSGLLLTRRGWLRWVLAAALAGACLLWADVGVELVRLRLALGQPWLRLALILGGVFALALASLLAALGRPGERFFHGARDGGGWSAACFLLVAAGLETARAMTPFNVLLLDRFFPGWGRLEIVLLAFYAAWLLGRMAPPAGARRWRPRMWALFSGVFFAQAALGVAGVERMLMTGSLHLPVPALILAGPAYRGEGFFMLILFTAAVLLAGPAWCSHLCYIGAWDDAASRTGRRSRLEFGRWTVLGRLLTLGLTVGGALALRLAGVGWLAAVLLGAGFGIAGVGVMALASRGRGVMVHCSTYCPIGLAGAVLGRLNPWRVRMTRDCTQCGACSKACRYGALEVRDIERGRPGLSCTLCGDCVGSCPHSAMEYRFPGLNSGSARLAFLTLVVALHAVFLGVARI